MILAKTCYLHTGKLGVKQHFFSCTQIKTLHMWLFLSGGGEEKFRQLLVVAEVYSVVIITLCKMQGGVAPSHL